MVAMYGPAIIQHTLPSRQLVTMKIITDYPFSESVVIDVDTESSLNVSLRIPSWTNGATVQTNSNPPSPATPGISYNLLL